MSKGLLLLWWTCWLPSTLWKVHSRFSHIFAISFNRYGRVDLGGISLNTFRYLRFLLLLFWLKPLIIICMYIDTLTGGTMFRWISTCFKLKYFWFSMRIPVGNAVCLYISDVLTCWIHAFYTRYDNCWRVEQDRYSFEKFHFFSQFSSVHSLSAFSIYRSA